MQTKFSEDVIPLADLKINPGMVVNQAKETRGPILLISRGRRIAVVQDLEGFEKNREELAFVKSIAQGLVDIKQENTLSIPEVKKRLGIKLMKISISELAFSDFENIVSYYINQGQQRIERENQMG